MVTASDVKSRRGLHASWQSALPSCSIIDQQLSVWLGKLPTESCSPRHAHAPACPLAATMQHHYGTSRQPDGATDFRSIGRLSHKDEYDVKAVKGNGITSSVAHGPAPQNCDQDYHGRTQDLPGRPWPARSSSVVGQIP